MDLGYFIERWGENGTNLAIGLVVGLVFGAFGQQSRFCLRAAVLEFAHARPGQRLAVWLLSFSVAVLATQVLAMSGYVSASEARQLASPQSLSGAALGGLMFGAGMVLARGCASRLLILSATGNLRALLSGLVFAVVAQASWRGILAPVRETLSAFSVTPGYGNNLVSALGLQPLWIMLFSLLWLVAGIVLAWRSRLRPWHGIAAVLAGSAIPLAWVLTSAMASQAFDPVQVESVTFTGPSADTLMMVLTRPEHLFDFDTGLVPGVFLGSGLAASLTCEFKLQGFEGGASMRRYLFGATLMGFGGMLAGGCAVGAGVTGASVFALTAWITLFAIWAAAVLTDRMVDRLAADGRAEPAAMPARVHLHHRICL